MRARWAAALALAATAQCTLASAAERLAHVCSISGIACPDVSALSHATEKLSKSDAGPIDKPGIERRIAIIEATAKLLKPIVRIIRGRKYKGYEQLIDSARIWVSDQIEELSCAIIDNPEALAQARSTLAKNGRPDSQRRVSKSIVRSAAVKHIPEAFVFVANDATTPKTAGHLSVTPGDLLAQYTTNSVQVIVPPAMQYVYPSKQNSIYATSSDSYANLNPDGSYSIHNVRIASSFYSTPANTQILGTTPTTLTSAGISLADGQSITLSYGPAIYIVIAHGVSQWNSDGSLRCGVNTIVNAISGPSITVQTADTYLFAKDANLYLGCGFTVANATLNYFMTATWSGTGQIVLLGPTKITFVSGLVVYFTGDGASTVIDLSTNQLQLPAQFYFNSPGGTHRSPTGTDFPVDPSALTISCLATENSGTLDLSTGQMTGTSSFCTVTASATQFITIYYPGWTMDNAGVIAANTTADTQISFTAGTVVFQLLGLSHDATWLPNNMFYALSALGIVSGSTYLLNTGLFIVTNGGLALVLEKCDAVFFPIWMHLAIPSMYAMFSAQLNAMNVPTGTVISALSESIIVGSYGSIVGGLPQLANVAIFEIGGTTGIKANISGTVEWQSQVDVLYAYNNASIVTVQSDGTTVISTYSVPTSAHMVRNGGIFAPTGQMLAYIEPTGYIVPTPAIVFSAVLGPYSIPVTQTGGVVSIGQTLLTFTALSGAALCALNEYGTYTIVDVQASTDQYGGSFIFLYGTHIFDPVAGTISLANHEKYIVYTPGGTTYSITAQGNSLWMLDGTILFGNSSEVVVAPSGADIVLTGGGLLSISGLGVRVFSGWTVGSTTFTDVTNVTWDSLGNVNIVGATTLTSTGAITTFTGINGQTVMDLYSGVTLPASASMLAIGGVVTLSDGTNHQFSSATIAISAIPSAGVYDLTDGSIRLAHNATLTAGQHVAVGSGLTWVLDHTGFVTIYAYTSPSFSMTTNSKTLSVDVSGEGLVWMPDGTASIVQASNVHYLTSTMNPSQGAFIHSDSSISFFSGGTFIGGSQSVFFSQDTGSTAVFLPDTQSMQFAPGVTITYFSNSLRLDLGGSADSAGNVIVPANTPFPLMYSTPMYVVALSDTKYIGRENKLLIPASTTLKTYTNALPPVLIDTFTTSALTLLSGYGTLQDAATLGVTEFINSAGQFTNASASLPSATFTPPPMDISLPDGYSYTYLGGVLLTISKLSSGSFIYHTAGGYIVYNVAVVSPTNNIHLASGPFFVSDAGTADLPIEYILNVTLTVGATVYTFSNLLGTAALYPDLSVDFSNRCIVAANASTAYSVFGGGYLSTANNGIFVYSNTMRYYMKVLFTSFGLWLPNNTMVFTGPWTVLRLNSGIMVMFYGDGTNTIISALNILTLVGNVGIGMSGGTYTSLVSTSLPYYPSSTTLLGSLSSTSAQLSIINGQFNMTAVNLGISVNDLSSAINLYANGAGVVMSNGMVYIPPNSSYVPGFVIVNNAVTWLAQSANGPQRWAPSSFIEFGSASVIGTASYTNFMAATTGTIILSGSIGQGYGNLTYTAQSGAIMLQSTNTTTLGVTFTTDTSAVQVMGSTQISSASCPASVVFTGPTTLSGNTVTVADQVSYSFTNMSGTCNAFLPAGTTYSVGSCGFLFSQNAVVLVSTLYYQGIYQVTLTGQQGVGTNGMATLANTEYMTIRVTDQYLIRVGAGATWNIPDGTFTLSAGGPVDTVSATGLQVWSTYTCTGPCIVSTGGLVTQADGVTPLAYIQVTGMFAPPPSGPNTVPVSQCSVWIPSTFSYTVPRQTLEITPAASGSVMSVQKDGFIQLANVSIVFSAYGTNHATVAIGATAALLDPLSGVITLQPGTYSVSIAGTSLTATVPAAATANLYSDGSISLPGPSPVYVNGNLLSAVPNGGLLYTSGAGGILYFPDTVVYSTTIAQGYQALLNYDSSIAFSGATRLTTVPISSNMYVSFTGTGAGTAMTPGGIVTLPSDFTFQGEGSVVTLPDTQDLRIYPQVLSVSCTGGATYTADLNQVTLHGPFTLTASIGAAMSSQSAVALMYPTGIVSLNGSSTTTYTMTVNDATITVSDAPSQVEWNMSGGMLLPASGKLTTSASYVTFSNGAYVQSSGIALVYTAGTYTASGQPATDYTLPTGSTAQYLAAENAVALPQGAVVTRGTCSITLSLPAVLTSAGLYLSAGETYAFVYGGASGLATLPGGSIFDLAQCLTAIPSGGTLSTLVSGSPAQSLLLNTGGSIDQMGLVTASSGFLYPLTVGTNVSAVFSVATTWYPDTGSVEVPTGVSVAVLVGVSQTDTFTLAQNGVLAAGGRVAALSGGAPIGYISAAGMFVLLIALPATITLGPMDVSVPQIGLAYTVPATSVSFAAASSGGLMTLSGGVYTLQDVTATSGTASIVLMGTQTMGSNGMISLLNGSSYALSYGATEYTLALQASGAYWALDGSVYVLQALLSTGASSVELNTGGFVRSPAGTVLPFPGLAFGGGTLLSFGSAVLSADLSAVSLSGACVYLLSGGSSLSFTGSASLSNTGMIAFVLGVLVTVSSSSRHLVLAAMGGDTAVGNLPVLVATGPSGKSVSAVVHGAHSILLNAGGVASTDTGNTALGDGTLVPLAANPSVYIRYGGTSVWQASSGDVLVPQGSTIATVTLSPPATIETYTAPTDVLVSAAGVVRSATNGRVLAFATPAGRFLAGGILAIPAECRSESSGLYVVVHPGGYDSAVSACAALSMAPASLDTSSIAAATALLSSCGGPWRGVFVGSWVGVRYPGTCLSLRNGATPGGSGTVVPSSCSQSLPILCHLA